MGWCVCLWVRFLIFGLTSNLSALSTAFWEKDKLSQRSIVAFIDPASKTTTFSPHLFSCCCNCLFYCSSFSFITFTEKRKWQWRRQKLDWRVNRQTDCATCLRTLYEAYPFLTHFFNFLFLYTSLTLLFSYSGKHPAKFWLIYQMRLPYLPIFVVAFWTWATFSTHLYLSFHDLFHCLCKQRVCIHDLHLIPNCAVRPFSRLFTCTKRQTTSCFYYTWTSVHILTPSAL